MATTRGRKSAASLAVASGIAARVKRLAPPVNLTEIERALWLGVVNDQPAESFTATHAPLLVAYVQHIARGLVLADRINDMQPHDLGDPEALDYYDKLLKMAERESRAASSLATRLRITRQAIDQQTVARKLVNAPKGRKPWETDDGDEA